MLVLVGGGAGFIDPETKAETPVIGGSPLHRVGENTGSKVADYRRITGYLPYSRFYVELYQDVTSHTCHVQHRTTSSYLNLKIYGIVVRTPATKYQDRK